MGYQVGDKVIHSVHGLGEIVGKDEKRLAGKTRSYYVVELSDFTVWVPVDESGTQSLHLPLERADFEGFLEILSDPGEELPDDKKERQYYLSQRIKDRNCENICMIIRDLLSRSSYQKLDRYDAEILNRAQEYLLNEWELSLGTSRSEARRQLQSYLVAASQGQAAAHT